MKKYAQILTIFKHDVNFVHKYGASIVVYAQYSGIIVHWISDMHNGSALIIKYAQKVRIFTHQNILYTAK